MKVLFAASLAFLLLGSASQAEDNIAPAKLELAKQVMLLSGATAAYDSYEKNLDLMVNQIRQYMPGADDATMADIKKIAVEEFTAYKPTLMENAAKVYAQHFTDKDLKGLIAFYKTDAGKHFAAEMPALSSESVKLTEPFTQRFMARLQEYIATRVAAEQKKAQEQAPAGKDQKTSEQPKGSEPSKSDQSKSQGK